MSDITQALRALRRSPWYAATLIGVIGLSIAMATTVFAVVDGVLFKPLPYEAAGELYIVSGGYSAEVMAEAGRRGNSSGLGLSAVDVHEIGNAVPDARLALFTGSTAAPGIGDLRAWVPQVARVGPAFFDVLGVRPLIGGLEAADFEPAGGGPIPGLISYETWQARFAGRLDVVGEVLDPTAGAPDGYRVAGVLGRDYLHPTSGTQPNVVAPIVLTPEERTDRARRSFAAIARLPRGVPLEDYQRRFNASFAQGRVELPPSRINGGLGVWDVAALEPLGDRLARGQATRFTVVFGAVTGLLLLGCLNVSGLMASRGIDRARELAVRRAIGASARHIARLVVTESAVVVLAGAVVGVLLSPMLLSITTGLLPANQALLKTPALDWRVAGFVLLVCFVAVAFVSMWPVVAGLRQPAIAAATARADGTGRAHALGRRVLVATQVALGFVLVLGGTMLVGSLISVWRTDVGFLPDSIIVVEPAFELGEGGDADAARDALLARLRAIPGVTAVGASGSSVLRNRYPGGMWRGDTHLVTEDFFDAAGLQLVEGRALTAGEVASGAAVAVLSDGMASAAFPDGPALGREFATLDGNSTFTVVGVVADVRLGSWDSSGMGEGQVYLPLAGLPRSLLLRVGGDSRDVLAQVVAVGRAMAGVQFRSAAFAEDLLNETIRGRRFQAWFFGAFALAALAIVGAGVLGLVAMATARRTREIGIRMSLGAAGFAVTRMILREQLITVIAGLAAGAVIAAWAVGTVERLLYEVTTSDPRLWLLTTLVILITATLGALAPALRASRVNPAEALRGMCDG